MIVRLSINLGELGFKKKGTLDSALGGMPQPERDTIHLGQDKDNDALVVEVEEIDFAIDEVRVWCRSLTFKEWPTDSIEQVAKWMAARGWSISESGYRRRSK